MHKVNITIIIGFFLQSLIECIKHQGELISRLVLSFTGTN